MPNEVTVAQKQLEAKLTKSLDNAASIITKSYLERLSHFDIIRPSEEDLDIDAASCGSFYRLRKLVYSREENFLHKLTTVVNVAFSIGCSIVTIIRSDGYSIEYDIGILSKKARDDRPGSVKRRQADTAAFQGALSGNLIGSKLEKLSGKEVEEIRESILSGKKMCYSSVSGIVALRDKESKSIDTYVQGMENLVDSLRGQRYTIVMLADPVTSSEIQTMKQGYEMLHTELAGCLRSTLTVNESDTLSLSKARSESFSEGISKGISLTQSKSRSRGFSFGGGIQAGVNFGIQAGISLHAGANFGSADSSGRTETSSQNRVDSRGTTDSRGMSKTAGRSLQLNYENRSVKALMNQIDRYLDRLDECESFGAFDCAAYVIAEDKGTVLAAASNYNALMRGQNSGIQASHINTWFKEEDTRIIGQYLGSLVHPRFWQNREAGIIVTPASIISGNELAIQIGLPKKSVPGVTVIPMASFGRNVMQASEDTLELGTLCHMGNEEGGKEQNEKIKVRISVESLAMHTFITGSTGKGKSTAIYSILDKLLKRNVKGQEEKIHFLVVEPAKGEYKDRFGSYDNVSVYGTNYKKTPLLRINPFSFPEDVHVLEHIDRLVEIFNVCWPMYAAMPAVLKDSIERAYITAGWDLETSECKYSNLVNEPLYPSFIDVLEQVNIVMNESAYSSDSKGDYKGALCTRLRSLTNGMYRQIFTSDELSSEELFDRNVIVDLSRTGSSETKALIMGLLVMKLQEYRMANASGGNAPLQHVTVLEEAHNILKRTSTEQSAEGANLLGKSVEMLSNSIAEMRTYGEGFIIADQAPGLLDPSVIRNTNTKIIFGLPDLSDRELVGKASGLNDDQVSELSKLQTFVAAVYQNNWLEAVLCKMETNFPAFLKYCRKVYTNKNTLGPAREKLLERLFIKVHGGNFDMNMEQLLKEVIKGPFTTKVKIKAINVLKKYGRADLAEISTIVYDMICNEATEAEAEKAETIDEWKACYLDEDSRLSEQIQNEIIECIIREQVSRYGKPIEYLEKWKQYLGEEVI